MGRAIKLVLLLLRLSVSFTFLVGLPAGIIKVMNEISENDNLAYAVGKNYSLYDRTRYGTGRNSHDLAPDLL